MCGSFSCAYKEVTKLIFKRPAKGTGGTGSALRRAAAAAAGGDGGKEEHRCIHLFTLMSDPTLFDADQT